MKRLGLTLLLTAVAFLAWANVSAENPPAEHPVLVVTAWSTNWANVNVTVENSSDEVQVGQVVVWFIFQGQLEGTAFELTVPAETTVEATITFPFSPVVTGVNIYEDVPDGVNEGPDPIAKVVDPDD